MSLLKTVCDAFLPPLDLSSCFLALNDNSIIPLFHVAQRWEASKGDSCVVLSEKNPKNFCYKQKKIKRSFAQISMGVDVTLFVIIIREI